MNTVTLIGRLTDDVTTNNAGNSTVANFSVAVDDGKDKTSFFDVTAWNQTAELLEKWGRKGARVGLSGKLEQQTWEKDGQKRSKVQVVVFNVTMIDWPEKDEQVTAAAGASDEVPF